MPDLAPIPEGVPIVDHEGVLTLFFRERWQQLIDGAVQAPLVTPAIAVRSRTSAIAAAAAYTALSAGLYRVGYYLRKTAIDGVSSSLTFTWGWTESGIALTESAAALGVDSITAEQSGSKVLYSDAPADLTYAVAYASNTPGQMVYRLDVTVERLR